LVAQIREENSVGWQRSMAVRAQASALQAHIELIAGQYDALQIENCLRDLNQELLAGLGNVELVHAGMGLERVAALTWPADIHPRASAETERPEDGVYRVEIWLGPALEDGKAKIRIAGAKRLEAALPTSSDRFRSALLAVFHNPLFLARPAADTTAEDSTDSNEQDPDLTNP
jgi:hypothetical protein